MLVGGRSVAVKLRKIRSRASILKGRSRAAGGPTNGRSNAIYLLFNSS